MTSVAIIGSYDYTPSAASSATCGASPEARMLALTIYNQLVQGESAKTSVNISQEQLKELRELIREALEEARESQEDSGFWGAIGDVLGGDIATLAQVVAVAAACVATGGAAAIVLGAIAVGCTLASRYAEELGIPPKVAIGIGIAAAVASVASGNIAAGAQGASLASASGQALQASGSVVQSSKVIEIAKDVQDVARFVAPAASAGGAVAGGVSGYFAGDALDHRADAQAARSRTKLEDMDIDEAVELLSEAIDRRLSAFEGASAAQASTQGTNLLIIQAIQG